MKRFITTQKAPAPIGPYNQAVDTGSMLFISGQIPVDPANGLIPESIEEQTAISLQNVKAILEEAGYNMTNVVKTSIFITDMNDFPVINRIYGEYFTSDFPARETVQVSRLPKDVKVEISAIAVK